MRALTVAVTGCCNLACEHCLVDAGQVGSDPHVPAATLLRLIREHALLGGRELWLTGGEPLLHPRWEDLLAAACAEPAFDGVVLQTNGALLGDGAVRALRRLARPGLSVQVSLDGASPATHDAVRGKGAFARTMEGLSRLRAAGLAPCVSIAFTELAHNLGDVPALLELVERLGLRRLVAGTVVADGRAAATGTLPPSPAAYAALLNRYHRDARFRERYEALGTIAAIEWYRGREDEGEDCCTLGDHPYLTSDGLLYPCALCRVDAYAVAGVHERPLADALAEGRPRWAALEDLKRRRLGALPACQGCAGLRHCGGGCMGRAYAAHGTFTAVEDRCELRKAVYNWR
jgi:radical SAM protein with 4Fe4S-binding SPASM domain